MPCRLTRAIQPEVRPASTEPIAIALYSQPTAPWTAEPVRRPPSGNSARGIASTIATMSTANDSSSTGVVAR